MKITALGRLEIVLLAIARQLLAMGRRLLACRHLDGIAAEGFELDNQASQPLGRQIVTVGMGQHRLTAGPVDGDQGDGHREPGRGLPDANRDSQFVQVDRELLGEEHKELTDDELLALVDTKRAERAKIRAAIAELGEQREAWLVNERETLGVDESASFDSPIRFALRDLAETRGFVFPAPKLAEVKAEQTAEEAEAVQAIELPVGGLREVGKNEVLEGC